MNGLLILCLLMPPYPPTAEHIKNLIPTWELDSLRAVYLIRADSIFAVRARLDSIYATVLGTATDSVGKAFVDSTFGNYGYFGVLAGADIKPAAVVWNAMGYINNSYSIGPVQQDSVQFIFAGATSDTVIMDSFKIYLCIDGGTTYLDSVYFRQGFKSTGNSATVVWGSGDNVGPGAACYTKTYSNCNAKFAWDWKPFFVFATTAGAVNTYIYTAIMYCHYQ